MEKLTPPNLPAKASEHVWVVNQIGVIQIAVGVAIGLVAGSLVAAYLLSLFDAL